MSKNSGHKENGQIMCKYSGISTPSWIEIENRYSMAPAQHTLAGDCMEIEQDNYYGEMGTSFATLCSAQLTPRD